MKQTQPSAEQLSALVLFAAGNGRTWKAALRECWMSGYSRADLNGAEPAALQQLRNADGFGPKWLISYRLPAEASAFDVQKYSNVFHYLSAEQFFAENRKDWSRSADLLNAISLLQAARNDLAPEWIASTRAFVARHPQLAAARR